MNRAFSNLSLIQINRLFPFSFVLDTSLSICEYGRSIGKIVDLDDGCHFFSCFGLLRPHINEENFSSLLNLQNQLVVLQAKGKEKTTIRGQFELIEQNQTLLFIGSPWFNDINELQTAGLSLFDFAFFDPLADLLQVVKNQQIANDDIKLLLNKLKQQKQALENSTKELQENQTRLQLLSTIAEKTTNGVIITDREGRINWVNESFTHMSGFQIGEIYGKKPGEVLQGEETDQKTVAYLSQQIQLGRSFACDLLNYRKNGEKYWVKILGNPLFDAKGEVIGFFALEEDITNRIQTEQALRDAKEKSDAIAHSKNVFLTNMSHEIRTPLNAILGMGQQLEKTQLSEQQKFYLETMKTAAEHLMVVINDILDISRVDAGKLNLENIDFDLCALVNRCINVLLPKAQEKGLVLEALIDEPVPDFLVGDPHRISQVLLNLLGNAIKFTERGSVRLFVSRLHRKSSSATIRFSIEDTGIGIDENFISELFAEFSQEDSSIVRKYGGTGLGLNITKKLVELMKGKIMVSSQKNEGTVFTVELALPIGKSSEQPENQPSEIDPLTLKDKIILLAEDNEMNRILARTVLHSYQVQLIEVDNGEKAVEVLKKQKVDLVLMDVQMPVMDGMAAANIVRNSLKLDVPILALTANALQGEREKCLAAGMSDYLAKPFREKDLISLIGKLLELSSAKPSINPTQLNNNQKRIYSFSYLNEIGENDSEFIRVMVSSFIAEAEVFLKEMPILLQQKDFARIRSLAHKIKSNLTILEIGEGAQLAEMIQYNENNNFDQQIKDLIRILREVLKELKEDGYLLINQ